MTKVNFKCITTEVFFKSLINGDYFIHDNKLFLKVNDISAFDFRADEIVLVNGELRVLLKDGNDIEITVK